jgi:hypothetical protein
MVTTLLPKDVQMTSFSPDGLINLILRIGVPSGPTSTNGLPDDHVDLDGGHPGLPRPAVRLF